MTVHSFKNGIEVHIPDGLTKEDEFARWTEAKVAMSILMMDLPTITDEKNRIKHKYNSENRRAVQIKRRTKTWRSPKKPGLFLK